ncbi:PREDICTED: gasdermin-D [Chrysochloris asiatica]|uniref:Gasdermin-D n=1 Tax=Chrysochloris asiatica TaxID=185453 RepID=A0A9B0WG35_CHRAS|nr:PREDICTED: gasdermin-D [Chrysochloris asiatica]
MPSAFEGVARSVVQELDRHGNLIPMDSLRSSIGYLPYCLLSRKPSTSWFWKPRYTCVNLSIRDILVPDCPEPDLLRSTSFHLHDSVDGQLQGSVELGGPGQGRITGGASVSGSSSASMEVCALRVDPRIWEDLQGARRLRQPEHKILKQLRSRGDNVYVVTEVLQTQKDVEITRTHKQEGSSQFSLPGAMCLQGEGQGHLNRKKTVTIPSGSILAFQVAQLVITDQDWDIHIFVDKKQKTFQQKPLGSGPHFLTWLLQGSGDNLAMPACVPTDGLEEWEMITKDFKGLQREVKVQTGDLEHLSSELRQELLGALIKLLLDTSALQALEEALEQGLDDEQMEPRGGPEGAILECLMLPSGELVKELTAPIFYLLEALIALSEDQRLLVTQALEMGMVSGQLKLVGNILEQTSPWQVARAVSLPLGLLENSWGEEAPAWVLLEECGLDLQLDTPQLLWEPQAQGRTCALYAALSLLQRLGQESQ